MTTRRAIALMLAAALGGALLYLLGLGARPADAGEVYDNFTTGCIIRFSSATPQIHANAAHVNQGCVSLSINQNGSLVVKHETVGPIVSLSVDSDETLTKKGIQCGGSGGIGTTVVACYDRDGDRVRVDSTQIRHPYANLWLTWVNTPSPAAG